MTDVLHVISGLGAGGAETMLLQLAPRLRALGLSQHVAGLSVQDTLAGDLRAAGTDVTVLGATSAVSSLEAFTRLLRLVNRLRPKIVQGWMYHGNIAATLSHCFSSGRRERRLFWNLRASNMDGARYGRIIWLSGLLSRMPDLVIANSEAGAAFHRGRGLNPRNLVVIPNGINTEKFRPDPSVRRQIRDELGISRDAVVVIYVARVDPMKDHDTFLAAMARLPAVTAIMVGNGTRELPAQPNVYALGLRRDTERAYAAADIVASTSAFGEGFSNVIAEGMSAGLVPVATDVGDVGRIIGDAGSLVPPRDPAAFSHALATLAALSKEERVRKGASVRARIVSNFSLESAVDRYFQLYSAPTEQAALAGAAG